MNIMEASNCGKRRVRPKNKGASNFRYFPWDYWKTEAPGVVAENVDSDWEVEEKKVEVTESQLEAALQKLHGTLLSITHEGVSALKEELGLKD